MDICNKKNSVKLAFSLLMIIALLTTGTSTAYGGFLDEIVFIDSALQDYEILMNSIPEGIQAVVLDGKKDGIKQMAEYLQNKSALDAIHIISHGGAGEIVVGTSVLSSQTLESYSEKLEIIGQSLKKTGDILLYGCDVARGESGKQFVEEVARITGADVAASEDATGSAERGGNWILEYQSGIRDTRTELFANLDTYPFLLNIEEVLIHTYSSNTWAFNTLAVGPDGKIYLTHKISSTEIAVKYWNETYWASLPSITTATTGDTGFSDDLDLVVGSDNKLHIVFKHYQGSGVTSHRGVKHGVYNGLSWQYTEIEAYSHHSGGRNFDDPAIAVDSTGAVHMVYKYVDSTGYYLRYATNYSGSWVTSTIVMGASGGIDEIHEPHIVIDENNIVHVAYIREDNQNDYYGNYYHTSKDIAAAAFPSAQKLVDAVAEGKNYYFTPLVVDGYGDLYFTTYEGVFDSVTWEFVSATSYLHTNKSGSWQREQVYLDSVRDTGPVGAYVVNSNIYLLMDSWAADWSESYFFAMANYGSGWVTGTESIIPALVEGNVNESTFIVDSSGNFTIVTLHNDLKKISSLTGTSDDFGLSIPAPAGNHTTTASAATPTPVAGANNAITLTVKNSLGNTDTAFSGARNVTIAGVQAAPNGSYGSFKETALDANSAGAGQVIEVTFINGVATANLALNRAAAQTIGFSIAGVTTPATNTLTITPTHGTVASMGITQNITAPAVNGGQFAQQPRLELRDAYGNVCTTNSSATVTATSHDSGSWTITGTTEVTAVNGVATFTNLGATNEAQVDNAQIAFNSPGLTEQISNSVTLPAPAGAHTALASTATLTPVVGANNAVTLTVRNSLGSTDTGFSEARNVTITGVQAAPNGSYGSFNGQALDVNSAGAGQVISVIFTNGVATANLSLNRAAAQTIGFSIAGVTTPATNTLTITPSHGAVASMAITQNITAPAANGGQFAQQPVVELRDAYGNVCTTNSSATITATRHDSGSWTLTGTTEATAANGVATFTNLGATNEAQVNGAQIAFDSPDLTQISSAAVTLPVPAGAHTAVASAATLTPAVGADNQITLTVRNSLGNTDTGFGGARNVIITGVQAAPNGTYGSFNGQALDVNSAGAGQVISVNFNNGVAQANLALNRAAVQTIGFSIAGVTIPATNTLTITPTHGTVVSMGITQNITAPAVNGGQFAQQPVVELRDTFGNVCTTNSSATVIATRHDSGSWTLTGTTEVTAVNGVVTFTNLGATNEAQVDNTQIAFNSTGLAPQTSATVTLPAPAGAHTAVALAATLTPVAGADNAITLTVRNTLGNTDTNLSGARNVTITGVQAAPNGTYGSFNGQALDASSAGAGQVISVEFTNGVAQANLRLNRAAAQTIGFSIAGVTTPTTNTLTITPTHGTVASMGITQNITAPAVNGGQFAQQPILELSDTYGNLCTTNSSATITATRHDSGSWTLTGTTEVTAANGIVTFTNLGATNETDLNGAQIAFNSLGLVQVTSNTVNLAVAQYTVTFDSQGGSAVAAITNVTHGTTVTLPAAPTREGYTFLNWNTAANDSGTTFNSLTIITGSIIVYAQWIDSASIRMTANPDNVKGNINFNQTFTLNVHNDTVTDSVYASDINLGSEFSTLSISSISNNSNTVTLAVYGSINTQGIGTISLSQSKLNLSTTPLIAEVVVSFNSIIYHGNGNTGGSVPTDSNLYEDGVAVTLLGNTGNLVKAGYAFAGWNTQANGQGTSYTQGSIVIIETTNLNLYAIWTAIPSGGDSSNDTGGGGTGGTTPAPASTAGPAIETGVVIIVNGEAQTAGQETIIEQNGEKIVELRADSSVLNQRIDEVIARNQTEGRQVQNVVEIPVSSQGANQIRSILTGDIVKKMEENQFTLVINTEKVDYIIPAKEIKIEKVANILNVAPSSIQQIEIELRITYSNEMKVNEITQRGKDQGIEIIMQPVEFEIVAKTTSTTGEVQETTVSHFTSYVSRVMEVPEGVDPSKITTGILYNSDGTFSHIPTNVFMQDNKWYAKLNSLTNSTYTVIWNPITVVAVENHWSKEVVNDMASRVVIKNSLTFEPNGHITRGEFAEYITKALGIYRTNTVATSRFTDVSAANELSIAITIATNYGIIQGYPDSTFRPDAKITREEAMTMYAKAMDTVGLTTIDENRIHNYQDKALVSDWAHDHVKKVVGAGVFNGRTYDTIDPKGTFTYAEAATAIRNLLIKAELINK